MIKYLFILSVVLFFAVGTNLTAKDDLVKLQKKEEKRRKKIKKSVIKITNENIIKLSKNSSKKVVKLSGSNITSSIIQPSQKNSDNQESNKNKDQEYWRSEKINLENSIKFYEEKVSTLTSRLNKLITDNLNTDYIPAKIQIKADIKKTRIELSKSKQQVPHLKNKLEQFLEEAKRSSIPPGWLR